MQGPEADGVPCAVERDMSGGLSAGRVAALTLEVVSFPEQMAEWDPERDYFYLELVGETSPGLDSPYGELAAATGTAAGGGTTMRVFEYTWTIGHLGVSQHRCRRRHLGRGSTQGVPAFSQTPVQRAVTFGRT